MSKPPRTYGAMLLANQPTKLVAARGTWRTQSIAATWRTNRKHAKTIGLTRLADLTGLDTLGLPVVSAIRPMAKSLSSQQGKGTSLAAARVSALMEALETWHAENLELPRRVASQAELGAAAIAVNRFAPGDRRANRQTQLTWVPAFAIDLAAANRPRRTSNRHAVGTAWRTQPLRQVWVPEQTVTLDCVFAAPPHFFVTSNGLASGNTLLEALLHATCEVVERDAEASWRASGEDRRIALETVDDPNCRALIATLQAAGQTIWAWDLRADIDIPVVGVALVEDPRKPRLRQLGVYQGFGCHPDFGIALSRALTEAAQTRLTYIAGARDDFFPLDYAKASDHQTVMAAWQRYTQPPDEWVDGAQAAYDCPTSRSLTALFDHVVDKLARAQVPQLLFVPLTQPSIGVPVVKVLLPGRAVTVEGQG